MGEWFLRAVLSCQIKPACLSLINHVSILWDNGDGDKKHQISDLLKVYYKVD